jgi:hypothetical protein
MPRGEEIREKLKLSIRFFQIHLPEDKSHLPTDLGRLNKKAQLLYETWLLIFIDY